MQLDCATHFWTWVGRLARAAETCFSAHLLPTLPALAGKVLVITGQLSGHWANQLMVTLASRSGWSLKIHITLSISHLPSHAFTGLSQAEEGIQNNDKKYFSFPFFLSVFFLLWISCVLLFLSSFYFFDSNSSCPVHDIFKISALEVSQVNFQCYLKRFASASCEQNSKFKIGRVNNLIQKNIT